MHFVIRSNFLALEAPPFFELDSFTYYNPDPYNYQTNEFNIYLTDVTTAQTAKYRLLSQLMGRDMNPNEPNTLWVTGVNTTDDKKRRLFWSKMKLYGSFFSPSCSFLTVLDRLC